MLLKDLTSWQRYLIHGILGLSGSDNEHDRNDLFAIERNIAKRSNARPAPKTKANPTNFDVDNLLKEVPDKIIVNELRRWGRFSGRESKRLRRNLRNLFDDLGSKAAKPQSIPVARKPKTPVSENPRAAFWHKTIKAREQYPTRDLLEPVVSKQELAAFLPSSGHTSSGAVKSRLSKSQLLDHLLRLPEFRMKDLTVHQLFRIVDYMGLGIDTTALDGDDASSGRSDFEVKAADYLRILIWEKGLTVEEPVVNDLDNNMIIDTTRNSSSPTSTSPPKSKATAHAEAVAQHIRSHAIPERWVSKLPRKTLLKFVKTHYRPEVHDDLYRRGKKWEEWERKYSLTQLRRVLSVIFQPSAIDSDGLSGPTVGDLTKPELESLCKDFGLDIVHDNTPSQLEGATPPRRKPSSDSTRTFEELAEALLRKHEALQPMSSIMTSSDVATKPTSNGTGTSPFKAKETQQEDVAGGEQTETVSIGKRKREEKDGDSDYAKGAKGKTLTSGPGFIQQKNDSDTIREDSHQSEPPAKRFKADLSSRCVIL
ncbi:hypothetical protein HK102_002793 [Quaeritorhiza haematococci]|nr:hypothetical protein HK102_002793 [Quaeritorhiza haematococci]